MAQKVSLCYFVALLPRTRPLVCMARSARLARARPAEHPASNTQSMDFQILHTNLTNPTLLYFLLGLLARVLRSDLEIPATTTKFIALYLLFSIGFRGGQELSHHALSPEIAGMLVLGLVVASTIPLYLFFILRKRLNVYDAGAVAASYGSVSAVTFVAASGFLELQGLTMGGHMVAVMALMEAPAIVVGVLLIRRFNPEPKTESGSMRKVVHHALTNGSVLMIAGSLVIGLIADSRQAAGIEPFTTDIFKGFLAIYLLEMGMTTASRFGAFRRYGLFVTTLGLVLPLVNGCLAALLASLVTDSPADQFIFAILAGSASYIAVPAAMRIAAPQADPGLYIPMALGVTFPFNIAVGMPVFWALVQRLA